MQLEAPNPAAARACGLISIWDPSCPIRSPASDAGTSRSVPALSTAYPSSLSLTLPRPLVSPRSKMSREPTTVYSQPANTGSGIHENTQLASAIDALKHHANPVRLEDFALSQGLPALLNPNSGLFARFKVHDRVMYDAKTDLWMYKPDYDLRTPADLVALLKDRYLNPGNGAGNSSAAGMRLAELRESYPAARDAIEELSKAEPREDREVLVLRGQRDGAIKQVFWNPLRGKEAKGVDDARSQRKEQEEEKGIRSAPLQAPKHSSRRRRPLAGLCQALLVSFTLPHSSHTRHCWPRSLVALHPCIICICIVRLSISIPSPCLPNSRETSAASVRIPMLIARKHCHCMAAQAHPATDSKRFVFVCGMRAPDKTAQIVSVLRHSVPMRAWLQAVARRLLPAVLAGSHLGAAKSSLEGGVDLDLDLGLGLGFRGRRRRSHTLGLAERRAHRLGREVVERMA
ncbi:hypothetical protein L1887_48583 [Cichorium endivia]|nr:hypothetical protein L1887_48583 [Cichorium endivia]